jgi:hypothetical protein
MIRVRHRCEAMQWSRLMDRRPMATLIERDAFTESRESEEIAR